MNDDPIATIRKLLIEDQGVPESKVSNQARIMHDLGIDGDDAAEIFQKLNAQFGTDFTVSGGCRPRFSVCADYSTPFA